MANYDSAIEFVLRLEDSRLTGKVTVDSDGQTRYGLLDRWHPDLVEAGYYTTDPITSLAMAKTCYKPGYWDTFLGDQVASNKIAAQILSIGINDGPRTAIKFAQEAVSVTPDGAFGPITLAAINATDETSFLSQFDTTAKSYYQQIAIDQPDKAGDLQGWYNRVDAINNYQG